MQELKELERLIAAIDAGRDDFRRQCARVDDWSRLFGRAFEHGVAGVLYHRLTAVGFVVPAAAREQAEHQFAVDRLWHRRTAAELQRILTAFERHDLRAVVLKGLVLGERVYPEATLRPAGDLDLLIAAGDIPRARQTLMSEGYALRVWKPHETPPAHAIPLEHANGGMVDLHHLASAGFSTTMVAGELIERSQRYRTALGGWAWVLSLEDEILYLAVHAARHFLARLGWLVDLRLSIEHQPDLRWDVVGARARDFQVRRAAALTLAMLETRLGLSLPDARAALRPDLRARLALPFAAAATYSRKFYSPRPGVWAKTCRVACDHTYRALLGDGIAAPLGFWCRSMIRSASRLRRG